MTIAFVHPQKSFLPEINAYINFFSAYGWNCIIIDPSKREYIKADVEWRFMGDYYRTKRMAPLLIHEYSSASTPPFRKLKDYFKSCSGENPDFRIFLNSWVRKQFAFIINRPFGFRDMGIYPATEKWSNGEKEFDFIYIGNLDRNRRPEKILHPFAAGSMRNHSILLLGQKTEWLQRKFIGHSNIFFKGPVKNQEVHEWLRKSAYAINYVPDYSPYIYQTSTKFLEYANLGMPIISSDYTWIREFQKSCGGNYFFIDKDFENFSMNAIQNFSFSRPDLSLWTWDQQIRHSGVLEFLKSKLPGINFADDF